MCVCVSAETLSRELMREYVHVRINAENFHEVQIVSVHNVQVIEGYMIYYWGEYLRVDLFPGNKGQF